MSTSSEHDGPPLAIDLTVRNERMRGGTRVPTRESVELFGREPNGKVPKEPNSTNE